MRIVVLTIACFLLALRCDAQRQLLAPPVVPRTLADPDRRGFEAERATLLTILQILVSDVGSHNQRCAYVETGSSLDKDCAAKQGELSERLTSYSGTVEDFKRRLDAAVVARIRNAIEKIQVPPPIPPEIASLRFGELAPDDKVSRRVLFGLEAGVAVVKVFGEVAGVSCPYCKLLLVAGKEIITAEDAADVYLTRQGQTYETALQYLRDPSTRIQFTGIVRALKESKPVSEDASVAMVRAAKAILDPKLGNSGTRIAWDAMWSPEAKNAMLTRATIELGGEILGGTSSAVTRRVLLARDPALQMAQEYLKTARKVREVTTDPDAGEALGVAIRESESIIEGLYRQASKIGEATGESASIFSTWAAEEHLTKRTN